MYICLYDCESNLRAALAAVGAADEVDMAAAVLVTTAIPALERLHDGQTNKHGDQRSALMENEEGVEKSSKRKS